MSAREIALGQIAQRLANAGSTKLDSDSVELRAAAGRVLKDTLVIAKDSKAVFASRSYPKGLPEEALRIMRTRQAQSDQSSLVGYFTLHGVDKATAEKLVEQEILQPV